MGWQSGVVTLAPRPRVLVVGPRAQARGGIGSVQHVLERHMPAHAELGLVTTHSDGPDRFRTMVVGTLAAARRIRRERPDVVLMDLRMPVLDGASATERLLAALPATRVVVLTTYETDADILRAQRLLASSTGVFVEPASAISVAGLLERHAAGEIPAGSTIASTVSASQS